MNADGTAIINTPFKWDPTNNVFYYKKQSKVFEKISIRTGISVESLQRELIIRAKLLVELHKRKIVGFDEVAAVVNEYHKNPVEILARFAVQG